MAEADNGQVFEDIVVLPFQELLDGRHGLSDHRGGPVWPDWEGQGPARHHRRRRPIDDPPITVAPIGERLPEAAWAGAIVPHFGHQIADFSMRILPTISARPGLPLAFSSKPSLGIGSIDEVPGFVWEILDWYGVSRDHVRFIAGPTLVERLAVYPQSEQLGGPGPDDATLDQLDALTERRLGERPADLRGLVYVSRVGVPGGRFAGEGELERVLERCGVTLLRPSAQTRIADELRIYRQAERIVFAEGSAMHALQLTGRLGASVTTLVRRPGFRLGQRSIEARVPALRYAEVSAGLVHGLRPTGEPAKPSGISVLSEERLLLELADDVPGLADRWDTEAFRRVRDDDIRVWMRRLADSPHGHVRGTPEMIARRLQDAGLSQLVDEARTLFDAATGPVVPRPPSPRTARPAPRRPIQRLNRLSEALAVRSYLEIGAGRCATLAGVNAPERTGVDPRMPMQLEVGIKPEARLLRTTSDAFFAQLEGSERFDLVYLNGVHVFEQCYRDLCNLLLHSHEGTAILVDGTKPTDPYASVRDPQRATRLRDADSTQGRAWEGDVFKVIFAVHDFHPGLDYATMVGPGRTQTLLWRGTSGRQREPLHDSFEAIGRLSYFDLLEHWDVLRALPEPEAIARCIKALSGRSHRDP